MPASTLTVATQDTLSLSVAPTLNQAFQQSVERYRDRPALAHKVGGRFRPVTYGELATDVRIVASALHHMGLRKGDRLAILAENGVNWAKIDLAALSLGVATVPIYSTLPPNQVAYILRDSGARIVFAGDASQLAKITAIRDEAPDLEEVVLLEGDPGPDARMMDDIFSIGNAHALTDAEYRAMWSSVQPEDMATLIYTSGTTGDPKGVELTHRNFMTSIEGAGDIIHWDSSDIFLSFLPLCHIYERALGYYLPLTRGSQIAYVEGNSSVERIAKLPVNFMEVKPTIFLGMPRLYEKMKEKIEAAAEKGGPRKKKIFDWAVSVGLKVARAEMVGQKPDVITAAGYRVADKLVFHKVKERVGGHIRYLVSAGAPLPPDVMEFFHACGLPIIEGYGLTETSPLISGNRPGRMRPGSVGQPAPNVEVRIAPDSEILARGANVMRGYWNKPQATTEAIDPDGWFHTGDLGEMSPDGFIKITGRKKDLIVLSNGKKVAPQDIEEKLKTSPYIMDLVLMGDGSQSVVALIVPAFELLQDELSAPEDRADLSADPNVKKLIKKELERLSEHLADFEKVRKFALMDHEFTIENGELTPTLKVKRHVLTQRYREVLAELMS